jgi:hypothetical protein
MEHSRRNNNMANQVQNQPTAAYWLSLIGGIIGVIVSLAVFALGAIAYLALGTYTDYYGYGYDYGAIGWGFTFYFAFGAWCLISSILIIVFARKLKANPMQHSKWGILILVFSIIGLGTLLGFIGGILALVYKPIPAGAAPQQYYAPPPQQAYQAPPPQQAHPCPQCGTMVQPGVRFCPNCGRQQY